MQARAGSAAAPLSDGRVLFTGGTDASGALATTEFFTPGASFSPGAAMLQARTNHTAVALRDGRVLVAGGTTIDGSFTNTAEIYDPSTNAWMLVTGGMIAPRSGHTASLLQDGRVLIAGGESASGLANTLEIFSPATNVFTAVNSGTLSTVRTHHAAAVLADGRVLIAGGSDGTNALNSADIFDPASGNVSAGGEMSMPRESLSVTTLLDGTVLIAGGNNGIADLVSAEIYDPLTGRFSSTGNLASARTGHVAFLLPNNNEVLIAGGSSSGTPLSSAELFVPWAGTFISTGALSSARLSAAGSALKEDGQLLIAGGTDGGNPLLTGELFNFATVTTDASDYPPGTTVNISGSGWQPGETVNLILVESPLYDTHGPYTALADSDGKIFNNQFVTDPNDLNIRFYLTAKGSVSQAQTTFTDGKANTVTVASPTSATAVAGNTANYGTVSISFNGTFNQNNPSCTAALSATGLPTGATAVFGTNPVTSTGNTATSTLSVTTNSATVPGTYTFTVTAKDGAGCQDTNSTTSNDVTLVVTASVATTTLALSAPSPASLPFGSTGPVTLRATLAKTSGGAVSSATVAFSVDGSSVGTAITDGSGVATLSIYNPSALATGSHSVQAAFAQQTISGTTYSASTSGTQTLNISKATPVITWANPADITYGTALSATQLNATASVAGAFVYSPAAGTVVNAGSQSLSVTFTPTDTTNYTTADKTVQLTVVKAPLTVTADNKSKAYGDANPTFTGTISGIKNSDNITATYASAATTTTNAGTYGPATANAIIPTLNDPGSRLGNYTVTITNGTLTVNKVVLTVKANDASMTYGGTLPTFSAAYSGFVNNDTASVLTGSPSFTPAAAPTTAGTSPITPAQGTLTAVNYTFTFVDGTLTVNKAVLTVKANDASMTYGGTLPIFSAAYSGFVNNDTASVLTGSPSFTPTIAPTAAGTSPITPAQGTLTAVNYTFTFVDGTLTVNKAVLTVKANDASMTYGGTLPIFSAAYSGFVNNDTASVLTGSPSFTPAAAPTTAGTSPITPAQGTLTAVNYTFTFVDGTLTVNKAVLTVKANDASMTYGGTLPTFSAAYSGFVNNDTASVLTGNPSFTPTTAPTAAGTSPITPAQGTLTAVNYTFTFIDGTLTVNKAVLTVKANDASMTYGGTLPIFSAAYSGFVNNDTASVLTGSPSFTPTIAPTAAGTSLITPAQGTLTAVNYTFTFVNGSLVVNKATLTAKADDQSKVYGAALPTLTGTLIGVVNGDGITATYDTAATAASQVGTYAITVSLIDPNGKASNYDLTTTNGTLTISKASLTVTADNATRPYGDANPTFTANYSGFKNGENLANSGVTGTPSLTTTATPASAAGGNYVITAALGTLAAANYDFTFVNSTLTITARPVTVTADAKEKVYGAADPALTYQVTSGSLVTGDTLLGALVREAGENVGTYAIKQGSLALSANYTLTYAGASLTITPATLTITGNNATRAYGQANPTFDASYSGFVNGDNAASLAGTLKFITTATQQSGVGLYPITPCGLISSNYAITFKDGTLTITPASLTITPDGGKSKTYGSLFSAFTATFAGLQNGDAVAVNYSSTGTPATAAVGPYDITVATVTFAQGSASNYNVVKNTATNGLTVNPATLTITPDGGKSKLLGATFSGFTGTQTGLQNSDAVTVNYTSMGAPASATVGAYDITVASVTFTQGNASNYTIIKNIATKGLTISYNACLLYDPTRAVKSGATYPIKFYLCDVNHLDVSSPAMVVNATAIYQQSSYAGAVEDAGNANPDSNFRYDATLGPSGGYIFNLKTSGLGTGGYSLTFTATGASNPSYSVGFGVK